MLIKWEGGSPQSGFPTTTTTTIASRTTASALRGAAILVNILSVITLSLAVPSSVPPPTTVLLGKSIGAPSSSSSSGPTTMYGSSSPEIIVGRSGSSGRRVPKQVGHPGASSQAAGNTDHESSGTHHHNHGFMGDHGHGHHGHMHHGHHGHGDGKYFMYAHNPGYDEYEYGYRRGNDYHFQERYEKYGPSWNFKTKVKWGDKYGGYGEHYWDYNHAGSGHDDGHGQGHYSEPVPTYENQPGASNNQKKIAMIHKRQSNAAEESGKKKDKYNKSGRTGNSSNSNNSGSKRITQRRKQKEEEAISPRIEVIADSKTSEAREGPMLVLDRNTGQIIDTQTGKAYYLKPQDMQYY